MDIILNSVARLFQMTIADTANALVSMTVVVRCADSLFHVVGRAQMTSTGYCRHQDAVVCQVGRGKTVEALEDDHDKLELYSLLGGELVEVAQYRCDAVKLSYVGHNVRC